MYRIGRTWLEARSTLFVQLSTRATSVVRSAESEVEDYECRVCRVATSFLKLSIQHLLRGLYENGLELCIPYIAGGRGGGMPSATPAGWRGSTVNRTRGTLFDVLRTQS